MIRGGAASGCPISSDERAGTAARSSASSASSAAEVPSCQVDSRLADDHAGKVTWLRHLTGDLTAEITMLTNVTGDLLADDHGYQVIQQPLGFGPVLAALIVAEIGGITRFRAAAQLCSWAVAETTARVYLPRLSSCTRTRGKYPAT